MSTDNVLLAVPNISEGRDQERIERVAGKDPELLDVHSDVDHNRSVLTYGGDPEGVEVSVAAMVGRAVRELDLREQQGVHPRFGVVDVLPFVPYSVPEEVALRATTGVVWRTADTLGVPIYFYGRAAYSRDEEPSPLTPQEGLSLPDLRRRMLRGFQPLMNHPSAGLICVGVRDPLIAFNVNFEGSLEEAKRVAREIRGPDVRALGFELPSRELVQVSMNLVNPSSTGPAVAFARVADALSQQVVDCEVVGLLPDAMITQLDGLPLRSPARSVDQALRGNS